MKLTENEKREAIKLIEKGKPQKSKKGGWNAVKCLQDPSGIQFSKKRKQNFTFFAFIV